MLAPLHVMLNIRSFGVAPEIENAKPLHAARGARAASCAQPKKMHTARVFSRGARHRSEERYNDPRPEIRSASYCAISQSVGTS